MKKEKGFRGKVLFVFFTAAALTFAGILAGCGSSAADSSASSDTAATETTEAYGWDKAADTEDAYEYTEEYAAAGDTADNAATGDEVYDYDEAETAEKEYDDAGNFVGSSADTEADESAAAESSDSQKLIKTVDMTVETTEFDELIAQLESKTEELGGYVESSETGGSSGSTAGRWSYLTIRIPADSLDEFVSLVGENANVTYTSESTEDVTLTYVDMESHLTALRTEQESLLAMMEQADSVESIIAIQSQLTEVRYEIESYESQLRVYDNRVNYSTVYLSIDEVERETSAAAVTFGESVRTRFSDNVYRVGQGFKNFAIGFLGALPFIIVVVVIAAILIVIGRFVLKRRKKRIEKLFENPEKDGDENEKQSI
ncbi:MAG: DUF4349 domain-containing protein [Clostridiales bacterium]|nr:DUF4349 domain-containing protein [Clostridiales bacterium]